MALIPLRIHAVQRERHDRQRVGVDRVLGPGRIDLRRHDVFDVVGVAHVVVGGGRVLRNAVVHDDEFRDHDAA